MRELEGDTTHRLIEYSLSQEVPKGVFILTRLVKMCGRSWMLGTYPMVIPAGYHNTLLNDLTQERLDDLAQIVEAEYSELNRADSNYAKLETISEDTIVRYRFFSALNLSLQPPTLTNTDGEPIGVFVDAYTIDLAPNGLAKIFSKVTHGLDKRKTGQIIEIGKGRATRNKNYLV